MTKTFGLVLQIFILALLLAAIADWKERCAAN